MSKKPVLLCIMDGFGWVPNETYGNAVAAAKTPHLDALMAKYPMTTIEPPAWLSACPMARWATLRWATPTWALAASFTSS